MSRLSRLGVLVAVVATLVAGWAAVGDAHPLGNFTVNTYSGLTVGPNRVSVDFVLDMAEIPAFQARQTLGFAGSAPVGEDGAQTFRSRECDQILGRVSLRADDHPVALRVVSTSLVFPPGQAGLTTLRLTCSLLGTIDRPTRLVYRSDNFTDRVGWREITAVGDRMTVVGSDVPASSISARLTAYPANLLLSPPDQRPPSSTSDTPSSSRITSRKTSRTSSAFMSSTMARSAPRSRRVASTASVRTSFAPTPRSARRS